MQFTEPNQNVSQIPSSLQRAESSESASPAVPSQLTRTVANFSNEPAVAAPNANTPQVAVKNGSLELPASESITINLEREKITSMCASNTTMTGSIVTTGGYRLDGMLDGELEAATTVVISEGANLTGNLKADKAVILGQVDGNVEVRGTLILARTAVVKGDISYGQIVNYQGSTIEGKLKKLPK